jgi:hypothetical protein
MSGSKSKCEGKWSWKRDVVGRLIFGFDLDIMWYDRDLMVLLMTRDNAYWQQSIEVKWQ